MMDLKFTEIIAENDRLGKLIERKDYKIAVMSNITASFLNPILELLLRRRQIPAEVTSGEYDNIIQDASRFATHNVVIIFWEISTIINGLQYKIELLSEDEFNALIEKVTNEIDMVLFRLEKTPVIIFNQFNAQVFSQGSVKKNKLEVLADLLNAHLAKKTMPNLFLADLDKIFASVSIQRSVDFRFYYSSQSLYTVDFYKAYAEYIEPIMLSVCGKAKKALIFDCDNTLWKGVLGEDGFNGIEMSASSKSGSCFEEVQQIALSLAKKGVIIGLCSKNNPEDVEEVIASHPDMHLRNTDIVIKKINWNDKAQNLADIAKDLNIADESLVFIDDSDFEINLIKDKLPAVTVFQVPSRVYDYPQMMRQVARLFYNISISEEDRKRNEMYQTQALRNVAKSSYANIDDYLASLELAITIFVNDLSLKARMAQMTQKTNQFNLTTKRYTEAEIEKFISEPSTDVLAFSVKDKFGEYGLTGMSIISSDSEHHSADIDSLLMSCRILGRNIESVFVDELVRFIGNKQADQLSARFIRTKKNQQVEDFYTKNGFTETGDDGINKTYTLALTDYHHRTINYIKVNYGRKD